MFELKIYDTRKGVAKIMECVNCLYETGIKSGVLRDEVGNKICEWRDK